MYEKTTNQIVKLVSHLRQALDHTPFIPLVTPGNWQVTGCSRIFSKDIALHEVEEPEWRR